MSRDFAAYFTLPRLSQRGAEYPEFLLGVLGMDAGTGGFEASLGVPPALTARTT
jgi:hypothetical protein